MKIVAPFSYFTSKNHETSGPDTPTGEIGEIEQAGGNRRKPHRIAFCITDLDPGGAERALVQLVTRLDRAEWEPHVLCLSKPGRLVDDLQQAQVPTHCLGARRRTDLGVLFRLYRALRRIRPQLLQTYLFHANLAGRMAAALARVPVVVSGIRVAEKRSRWPLRWDRWTDRLVDRHVCVSRAVADFSIQSAGLPPEKIVVIPNGVDAEQFARAEPVDLNRFGIPDTSRTLLFVGRLDPQKHPLLLLEAVQPLFNRHADLQVLLVGEGPLQSAIRDWIEQRQLDDRIHLGGWRPDVAGLMRSAFALVLPSRWEGLPNVVLEAMAAGLPVVATEVEGTAELISDRKSGLLVPPDAPRQLTAAIETLLEDAPLVERIRECSQQIVNTEFTWSRVVRRYTELYSELLGPALHSS